MFGTPSNHSGMFRCASSHDAMRWSGVAWAKINPEYGSTATNTYAFMRRPVTGLCISSNWCEQCRHLFWTLSAFMLDGMGGWLVSLVVVYFMSEWVFR